MNTYPSGSIAYNFHLAFGLVWKSLRYHRLVSYATILGVATGMCVVTTILIVDHNTAKTVIRQERLVEPITMQHRDFNVAGRDQLPSRVALLPIQKIAIIRQRDLAEPASSLLNSHFPTQELQTPVSAGGASTAKGEEDYQTMRLAIRMASMFAFFIGSVIVFYTMRFSVAMRVKEFALLLCLGEHRRNVSLSLILESLVLGIVGTLAGVLVAYPTARTLLAWGISTTGRDPSPDFSIPYPEILLMVFISLLIVLLGVISPVRTIYRLQISRALQPRFVEGDINKDVFQYAGLSWLLPALLLASYLAVRPFLEDWLSVVYFFLLESIFIVILTLSTIWLTRPFLRLCIGLIEVTLKRFLPLETLLSVRRIRLSAHNFVFSITAVVLVFSLLGGLHAVTRSLKHEIYYWSSEAMSPYFFYHRDRSRFVDTEGIKELEEKHRLHVFRLSAKVEGAFPMRLIQAEDINRYRKTLGQAPLTHQEVIFSRTLAARYGVQAGDFLHMETDESHFDFQVAEVSDALGTFAKDDQYVDIKSFSLFSNGHPIFRDNLERTLGDYAVVRSADPDRPKLDLSRRDSLEPFYRLEKSGWRLAQWQLREINSDFLIFDFILFMTVVLAFIGTLNTLLIQVHSRSRELSILMTLGVDQLQTFRLLLAEGLVIGVVGALLSVVLGTALGVVSVSFLDRFTLFDYEYIWSTRATLLFASFAVFTCCVSALYPALVATRISTAESLHYE